MKTQQKKLINLFIRYLIILAAGIPNLWLFYKILTPLTKNSVAFILNLFSQTTTIGNIIIFNSTLIELIPACIAGSAYYLLLILILATPNIKLKQSTKIILFSFTSLFILNIIRITSLALLNQSIYFSILHIIFWYVLSTLFVVGIWLADVKIFKIKNIPVYDDLRFVLGLVKNKK